MYKLFILFLLIIGTTSLAFAKEPSSAVNKAYSMILNGRYEVAEVVAKRAYEQSQIDGDRYNQGEALVALGLVYKTKLFSRNEESITNLRHAIAMFGSINYYAGVSKAKFALGNAYGTIGDSERQCDAYHESLVDFAKGKELNPDEIFVYNISAYSSFEEQVNDFIQRNCG